MVTSRFNVQRHRFFAEKYPELLKIAHALVRKSATSLIEPDELVNEFFIRESRSRRVNLPRIDHFLRHAKNVMTGILTRRLRSNDRLITDIDVDDIVVSDALDQKTLELHEALDWLDNLNPQMASVISALHFAGLTIKETATLLQLSPGKVERDWRLARTWLRGELTHVEPPQQLGRDGNAEQEASTPTTQLITFNQQLYEWLLEDTSRLYSLTDEAFENLVADRLAAMGLGVQRVGSVHQNDGGVDLIAWPQTGCAFPFLLAAQVKHHNRNRKTGQPAVRDFHGVVTSQGSHFHLGLVVTNTSFSASAKWFAQKNSKLIRLRDLADLCRWMRNDFLNEFEWREIPDRIELAPGINVHIPKKQLWLPD